MKPIIQIIILLLISNISISQNIDSNLITKFRIIDNIPKNVKELTWDNFNNNSLNYSEIEFLGFIPVNQIRFSENLYTYKYFSYGKYIIDSTHYLLIIIQKNQLDEFKIFFLCFDNKIKNVTSTLIGFDYGCVEKSFEFDNKFIFTIKTEFYCIPNGQDPPPNDQYIRKTIIENYSLNKQFIFCKLN
jgi:hypothetical protein